MATFSSVTGRSTVATASATTIAGALVVVPLAFVANNLYQSPLFAPPPDTDVAGAV